MVSWVRWGIVLGFAIGGFFDGILLHQILQWHHLLSLVPSVDTIRAQVLWDGYFHALMYVVAIVGLFGLWRSREALEEGWGRALLGSLLIGFGLWHVVDSVLSHWLLGIHRIKPDSPNPLVWDLIWFIAFGLLPIFAGWLIWRRDDPASRPPRGPTLAVLLVGLATAGMAVWSSQPPSNQPFTTVVFAPGLSPADALNAVVEADARMVWADPKMAVVVVDASASNRLQFYRSGALLVAGSGVPAGCFNWSKGIV